MTDDLTAALLAMEHGFWGAATDPDFYRDNMADEAVMVFPYGVGPMDKAMVIYAIGVSDEEWVSYDISGVRVVPISDDAGVITYKVAAERTDGAPFKAFIASTYVRRDGRWLLMFHQQTLASTGV